MIDIFNQVHKQNPDAVLLLIGEGELVEQTKTKVREL